MNTVKNDTLKVLVVCEMDQPQLKAAAASIRESLADAASINVLSPADVTIPGILASNAYVFGVADANAAVWNEVRRLFQGINLAGRKALFFHTNTQAVTNLKAAFSAAELSLPARDLAVTGSAEPGSWARSALIPS